MYYLLLSGVKENVKKVSLARLLHYKGGLPLIQAKETVDDLLVGKKYVMTFSSRKKIVELKNEAAILGAEIALFSDKNLTRIRALRTTGNDRLVKV